MKRSAGKSAYATISFLTRAGLRAASIYRNAVAGDPGGLVGGQEQDQFRGLLGLPHAAQGMGLLGMLQEGLVLFLAHPGSLVQVRQDHAGIDGVDSDAEGGQLQGRAARELVDRRLVFSGKSEYKRTDDL